MTDASNDPQAAFPDQGQAVVASMLDSGSKGPLYGSRQWKMAQAVASATIEGYVPHPDFLADAELLCQGLITDEEMQQRIKRRALKAGA